jgi:hypothetical protein
MPIQGNILYCNNAIINISKYKGFYETSSEVPIKTQFILSDNVSSFPNDHHDTFEFTLNKEDKEELFKYFVKQDANRLNISGYLYNIVWFIISTFCLVRLCTGL